MQTYDAITARRNVRTFTDTPIAAGDLDRILDAGRRAPSSQNWQPWDFVLVTDRAQLTELAEVFSGAYHVAQSAATIAIVGPPADNPFRRAQFDLGQAALSMAIAAADLGIGSCHAGVSDMALARRVLDLPADRDWVILLSLGYPADRPLTPVRNPKRRALTRWSTAAAGDQPGIGGGEGTTWALSTISGRSFEPDRLPYRCQTCHPSLCPIARPLRRPVRGLPQ